MKKLVFLIIICLISYNIYSMRNIREGQHVQSSNSSSCNNCISWHQYCSKLKNENTQLKNEILQLEKKIKDHLMVFNRALVDADNKNAELESKIEDLIREINIVEPIFHEDN